MIELSVVNPLARDSVRKIKVLRLLLAHVEAISHTTLSGARCCCATQLGPVFSQQPRDDYCQVSGSRPLATIALCPAGISSSASMRAKHSARSLDKDNKEELAQLASRGRTISPPGLLVTQPAPVTPPRLERANCRRSV